jgi:hypothetical protein
MQVWTVKEFGTKTIKTMKRLIERITNLFSRKPLLATPVVMCSFNNIESNHKSVYIQKFSCTSSTCDFHDLDNSNLPSKIGISNNYHNIWRVKISRKEEWKHFTSLEAALCYLSKNCT